MNERTRTVLLGIGALAAIALVAGALWTSQAKRASRGGWEEKPLEGLQVFGQVPPFKLTERSGAWVTEADLKGRVSVVNFIYTNCPDTCPLQSAEMRNLQEEFDPSRPVRFVSITVDPQRDTPQVLQKYAARFKADPKRWLFLTGKEDEIRRLAEEGFHLSAAEIPEAKRPASGATHAHSPRFVLLDREARIRGYYASTDKEALARLRRDARSLLDGSSQ
ncbi:MAG TPA: SCO family protein [Candidatus Acidoferrales bacterium]|nr:SCO family protein [Candidatus Acidoferrales bacterium]